MSDPLMLYEVVFNVLSQVSCELHIAQHEISKTSRTLRIAIPWRLIMTRLCLSGDIPASILGIQSQETAGDRWQISAYFGTLGLPSHCRSLSPPCLRVASGNQMAYSNISYLQSVLTQMEADVESRSFVLCRSLPTCHASDLVICASMTMWLIVKTYIALSDPISLLPPKMDRFAEGTEGLFALGVVWKMLITARISQTLASCRSSGLYKVHFLSTGVQGETMRSVWQASHATQILN